MGPALWCVCRFIFYAQTQPENTKGISITNIYKKTSVKPTHSQSIIHSSPLYSLAPATFLSPSLLSHPLSLLSSSPVAEKLGKYM